ncbi:hypothetical protein V6Z12_D02G142700 [Gossypium hirsutum]
MKRNNVIVSNNNHAISFLHIQLRFPPLFPFIFFHPQTYKPTHSSLTYKSSTRGNKNTKAQPPLVRESTIMCVSMHHHVTVPLSRWGHPVGGTPNRCKERPETKWN